MPALGALCATWRNTLEGQSLRPPLEQLLIYGLQTDFVCVE